MPTEAVQSALTRINAWFTSRNLDLCWRPGASEAQIVAFEQVIGRRLPDDYRAFLALHDGQEDTVKVNWLPCAGRLGSIASIITEYRNSYAEPEPDADAPSYDTFSVEDTVRAVIFHPGRVPIGGMPGYEGRNMHLDFIPGERGEPGQVVTRHTDEDFTCLGDSFLTFLERTADLLDNGAVVWDTGTKSLDPRPDKRVRVRRFGTVHLYADPITG